MPNVTLSVDEEIIRKVRRIALDRNTTLTEMVREFLISVANRGTPAKERAIANLEESFAKYSRDMGERAWTRETLHDR